MRNSLNEIWIPEMIVSEQIVLNEELDLTQLQKGQHFALISEFFGGCRRNCFKKLNFVFIFFCSRSSSAF